MRKKKTPIYLNHLTLPFPLSHCQISHSELESNDIKLFEIKQKKRVKILIDTDIPKPNVDHRKKIHSFFVQKGFEMEELLKMSMETRNGSKKEIVFAKERSN